MATNNAVMQEDRVSDKLPALIILSGSCKMLKRSIDRALVLVLAGLASITCPNILGAWLCAIQCISAYPLLSAYCHSVYHYSGKRNDMRFSTRVYGNRITVCSVN